MRLITEEIGELARGRVLGNANDSFVPRKPVQPHRVGDCRLGSTRAERSDTTWSDRYEAVKMLAE